MFGAEHAVTLTWNDTNPVGTTFIIKRANGVCSPTSVFTEIKTGITEKTYEDTPIQSGFYCYVVVSVYNGQRSVDSNQAGATVPLWAPTGLTGVTSVK